MWFAGPTGDQRHPSAELSRNQSRYIPTNGCRAAFKPVGHDNLVLGGTRGGHDVRALDSLREVSKNVIDDHNGLCGLVLAGHVWSREVGLMSISIFQDAAMLSRLIFRKVHAGAGGALTGLETIEVFIFALVCVLLGRDNGRDIATSLTVAVLSRHCRHVGKFGLMGC